MLVNALNSQKWPNCGSIEKFSTVSCVVCGPFLEGSTNLTGPQSSSVFIQDGGFENSIMNISAKETKWTGWSTGACSPNLKILIKKYCLGSVTGTFEKQTPRPEPNVCMRGRSCVLQLHLLFYVNLT